MKVVSLVEDNIYIMNTHTIKKKKIIPEVTERISGSEAVLRCLLEEGIDVIFGYPGGAIMPVYDALYHYEDRLKHILTRHEQGAIHAAQGLLICRIPVPPTANMGRLGTVAVVE